MSSEKKSKKRGNAKSSGGGDARFDEILWHPKFHRLPRREKKMVVDSRFESMFTDSRFRTDYQLDKRGRPIFNSARGDENFLERFYELEKREKGELKESSGSSEGEPSDSGEDDEDEVRCLSGDRIPATAGTALFELGLVKRKEVRSELTVKICLHKISA